MTPDTQQSLVWGIFAREMGLGSNWALQQMEYKHLCRLGLSRHKWIDSGGGSDPLGTEVRWMALENDQCRWLLAALHRGSILLFDVQHPERQQEGWEVHTPVAKIDRSHSGCHKFSVSAVEWYPVDNGIFVSGAFDAQVKVWDVNRWEVAWQWDLESRVHGVAMSQLGMHCLIGVSREDHVARICDMNTGSSMHSLSGHTSDVLCITWSRINEFQLYTGAKDGQVRLWDIRQSGCLHVFDYNDTETKCKGGSKVQWNSGSERLAHRGGITHILQSPDGRRLFTAGTDDRLIRWGARTCARQLVHYPKTFNRALRARQMSISHDGRLLFFPSGSVIQMYDADSGDMKGILRGHMTTVGCCQFNDDLQELYSGAGDLNIPVWDICDPQEGSDHDAWSD